MGRTEASRDVWGWGRIRPLPVRPTLKRGFEAVVPNPKLKLMDQVQEVLRLKPYAIRTETCYCDWIRRYIRFHQITSPASYCARSWTTPKPATNAPR